MQDKKFERDLVDAKLALKHSLLASKQEDPSNLPGSLNPRFLDLETLVEI